MMEKYVAVCQCTVGEKKIIGVHVCVNIYGIGILNVVVQFFYFNMYVPKSH